jgi:hypothetical protein
MRVEVLVFLVSAASLISCATPDNSVPIDREYSVWAVDFIRILPGGEDDYLVNIRGNWAQARDIAIRNGDVLSFQSFMAETHSGLGWDIMLMTQYPDSGRWANREQIFSAIFESTDFERIEIDRPSSELREFVGSEVMLRPLVSNRAK